MLLWPTDAVLLVLLFHMNSLGPLSPAYYMYDMCSCNVNGHKGGEHTQITAVSLENSTCNQGWLQSDAFCWLTLEPGSLLGVLDAVYGAFLMIIHALSAIF